MRVLVALDGGPLDEALCRSSAYLCERGRDTAVLVTVLDPAVARETVSASSRTGVPPPSATASGLALNLPTVAPVPAEDRDQAVQRVVDEHESRLRHFTSEFFEHVPTGVRVVLSDDAAKAIIEQAEEEGVDGIAVGARRRSGLAALLGTVASAVVRSSPVPVLVIREGMRGT